MHTVAEPPEVAELRGAADRLVERVQTLAEADGTGLRRIVGLPAMVQELRRLEPKARRSCWVMQPHYAYDPEDPGVALTRSARERGIDTALVTLPATLRTHPLLPSIFPSALIGPCFLRAMVVDGAVAMVGGPDAADGERVSWLTTRPEVLADLVALWEATLPHCSPVLPPGEEPPLTERQLDVARLLCVGEKDKSIARLLSLSARTVEREVSALLTELGAGSRAEAVLLMCGRGVNGGRPGDVEVPLG